MKIHGMIFTLILGLSCAKCFAFAEKPVSDWLMGTWTLCNDPDGDSKDSLQFNADGSGWVIREKGNIEFVQKHADERVYLLGNGNGYAIPIELGTNAQHDKLLLRSDKTGSTSTYVRTDGNLAGQCSLK
jgi:hypothetical protein